MNIFVKSNRIVTNLNKAKTAIKAGKTYTVEVPEDGYDPNTGYIVKITVKENTKGGSTPTT